MPRANIALVRSIGRHGVFLALIALILFGWLRYENVLGGYNVLTVLRYNSMFALVALEIRLAQFHQQRGSGQLQAPFQRGRIFFGRREQRF